MTGRSRMLDFLGALWHYAAEYFIALMGVAAFAGIIYYGGKRTRQAETRAEKIIGRVGVEIKKPANLILKNLQAA